MAALVPRLPKSADLPDGQANSATETTTPVADVYAAEPVVGPNSLVPVSTTISGNGGSNLPEVIIELSDAPPPETARAPASKVKQYLRTDVGNAERLVDAYGSELIYCPEHLTYMAWTGQCWKPDHDGHLVEARAENTLRRMFAEAGGIQDKDSRDDFLGFISRSLSRRGISDMCYSARRKVRAMNQPQFDSKPWLLNFPNGTVDLRSGRLQPHSKLDLITKMIAFPYNPKAACPLFLESLSRILPDQQLRDYIQTVFGCASTGKPEKALFVFTGTPDGDNGKTTLLEIIRKALGDREYAGQVMVETIMMKPKEAAIGNNSNADLADLAGKRFITSSESDKRQRLNCAKVKYLTGRSQIRARYLRKPFFDFEPTHKLFLDCNYPPVMDDPNDAVWNRVRIIPFKTRLTKDQIDPGLYDKLTKELPGIAVWIVEGAKRYFSDGLAQVPIVQEATEAYRAESDALSGFYADRCRFGPAVWVSKTELWDAYREHSRRGGREILGKTDFEARLRARGLLEGKRDHGTVRAWVGVELAGDEDNDVQLDQELARRVEILAASLNSCLGDIILVALSNYLDEERVPAVGTGDLDGARVLIHVENLSSAQKSETTVQINGEVAQRSKILAANRNLPLSEVISTAVSSLLDIMDEGTE